MKGWHNTCVVKLDKVRNEAIMQLLPFLALAIFDIAHLEEMLKCINNVFNNICQENLD